MHFPDALRKDIHQNATLSNVRLDPSVPDKISFQVLQHKAEKRKIIDGRAVMTISLKRRRHTLGSAEYLVTLD
jgi:hypothetical protein